MSRHTPTSQSTAKTYNLYYVTNYDVNVRGMANEAEYDVISHLMGVMADVYLATRSLVTSCSVASKTLGINSEENGTL